MGHNWLRTPDWTALNELEQNIGPALILLRLSCLPCLRFDASQISAGFYTFPVYNICLQIRMG